MAKKDFPRFSVALMASLLVASGGASADSGGFVYTSAASNVTQTSAQLNGSIFVGADPTYVLGFLFGQTNPPLNALPASPASVSNTQQFQTVPFSYETTGLACNTTYYFQSLMNYTTAIEYGAVDSFQTLPCSIPTLSEWAQLMLALMVMTVIGLHFHRERSY
jgi:hypothetical protein